MISARFSKDLVVLTADGTISRTIQTLMADRREELGISAVTVDFQTHRHRDSGCRSAPGDAINPLRNSYRKGMVIFDFHGSGESSRTAIQLEMDLGQQLQDTGWQPDGIAVVAIEPELEAWVFGASVHRLERLVGWSQPQSIRDWLQINGFLASGETKPNDPQAAFDGMLRAHQKRRSRRLFADLARTVNFSRCQDRAFQKFRATLQRWFLA